MPKRKSKLKPPNYSGGISMKPMRMPASHIGMEPAEHERAMRKMMRKVKGKRR